MKSEQIWRWALVGSLGLIGAGLLNHATGNANANLAQSQPAAQPVAVVSLERLIDMLDERAKREQELQRFGEQLEGQVNRIREQLRAKLDERETASASRRGALFEEIVRLRANLEAEQQYASQIAGELLTRLKRDLYSKVLSEVSAYAASAGYSLVISNDSGSDLPPPEAGLQALEISMTGRTVLYARNTVDITEAVANRMNANYAQSGGSR